MIFDKKNCPKNKFVNRFIDIRLENVAVAAARVVGDLRAAVMRGVKSVYVYKTPAKIIISSTSETTGPETAFTSL